jgi:hypothetical protein
MKTNQTTRKFCQKQIERFMVFETSFPKATAGVQVLVDALVQAAASEDHARRIVDHLVETTESFCPLPAAIHAASATIPREARIPSGCSACEGTGWRSVLVSGDETVKLGDAQGRWGQARCEYVSQRCSCPRGQRLAAMDAERKGAA